MRTRAERRRNNIIKSLRKQKLCQEIYHLNWYDNLHEYSKNKIHCSCPMCAAKTNGKKIKYGWQPKFNPTIKDLKQIEKLNYNFNEYLKEEIIDE